MTDKIEVKQEDRVVAASVARKFSTQLQAWEIEQGRMDGHPITQAFAAHRIAAEQKAKAHWLEEAAKVADETLFPLSGNIGNCDISRSVRRKVDAAIRSLGEQE